MNNTIKSQISFKQFMDWLHYEKNTEMSTEFFSVPNTRHTQKLTKKNNQGKKKEINLLRKKLLKGIYTHMKLSDQLLNSFPTKYLVKTRDI